MRAGTERGGERGGARALPRCLAACLLAAAFLLGVSGCAGPRASGEAAPSAGPPSASASRPPVLMDEDLGWDERGYDVSRPGGGKQRLCLLVASTPAQVGRGLSVAPTVPRGADGMVFELAAQRPSAFWMRGMRYPLDIAFVDAGGAVLERRALPVCKDTCPEYAVPEAAVLAVEVPSSSGALAGASGITAAGACGG